MTDAAFNRRQPPVPPEVVSEQTVTIRVEVHVYSHPPSTPSESAASVDRKLDSILTQTVQATRIGASVMATVSELKTKLDALQVSVDAETDLSQSIVTFLQGEGEMIASLKQQLADALAAGGDQGAAIQAAIDQLGVIQTTNDANAKSIADAMIANTPAARA